METQFLFIDEAGTPDIFGRDGEPNVQTGLTSRYFMLGKLEVEDPPDLAHKLNALRTELLVNPYFAGVESFKPERKKTALYFHAKDDLPEVRLNVFNLLRSEGERLRFHAVVCDKAVIVKDVLRRNAARDGYRYQENDLYDRLMQGLFKGFHTLADHYNVCIARRGSRDRTVAFRTAIENADKDFERSFGFRRGTSQDWTIRVSSPEQDVCLQAADYFLWALQRFYEPRTNTQTGEIIREDRYLKSVWPQVGEIHDLHHSTGHGTLFNHNHPLTIATRFPEPKGKTKKP